MRPILFWILAVTGALLPSTVYANITLIPQEAQKISSPANLIESKKYLTFTKSNKGSATYQVVAPKSGLYRLTVEVIARKDSENSVYFSINSASKKTWHFSISKSLKTNEYHDAVQLNQGANTLVLSGREPYIKIAKIEFIDTNTDTPAPTPPMPTPPAPTPTPTPKPPVSTPTPKPPVSTPTPKPPVSTPTPKPPVSTPTPKPPVSTPTPKPPVSTPTPKPPVSTPTPKPPAPTPTPTPIPPTVTIEDGVPLPTNCPLLTEELKKYPTARVKSFKSFGAKGDGISDDYDAFKAASTAISNKVFTDRQIIYFPAGRYYIDRFVRVGNVNPNTNSDIQYVNSKNFSLIGCQAAIDVKGDFTMVNDWTRPAANNATAYFSNSRQLTPFVFDGASNFKLSGLEINGSVNKLKRDQPAQGVLAESRSHAIITGACSDYELSHLRVHHFAADGLYLGGNKKADFNVIIDHLESHNNARQGLSIIQAGNVKITNSIFRDTGKTEGTYQGHSPQAGVDIEPNFTPESGASLRTGNILFENCTFKNNLGSQLVTNGFGHTVVNVTIRKSEVTAQIGNSPYVIIFPIVGGIIEDSVIDTGAGSLYPSWLGNGSANVNTIVRRNTIKSSGPGILMSTAGSKVVIENNTFISQHDPTKGVFFPYIQNGVVSFSGNTLHYDTKNFGTRRVVGLVQTVDVIDNNTITTNRTDSDYWIGSTNSKSITNTKITGRILFHN